MKVFFAVALCATILASCTKEDDEKEFTAIVVDVNIRILDKDSCDLLNPVNKGCYNFSEIGLYKNSELTEKRHKKTDVILNEDVPQNKNRDDDVQFLLYESNNLPGRQTYSIHFFAPVDYSTERNGETIWYATSYLKLDASTIDTIYTEIMESGNVMGINKIMYNGLDITKSGIVIK